MSKVTMETVADDLAYARSIAEEGRAAPLLGGRQFVIWGLVVVIGSMFTWATVSRAAPFPPASILFVWLGLTAAGWIYSFATGSKLAQKPGAQTTGAKVEQAVWVASGAFFGLLATSFTFVAATGANGEAAAWLLYAALPPVIFGVYAVALTATMVASSASYLKPFIVLSYIFAIVTALLIGSLFQFFATSIGILLVSVVPGVLMLRREPDDLAS